MNDEQIRIDDCRTEVLRSLYHRRLGAHSADTIRSVFLSNRDYGLNEVKTALKDLQRLHYVEAADDGMTGAQEVWQITGDGLKFIEKGGRR